jgi:peptidoglycan/xylan/chitin deacetylase (PgdA/CDA1 family)
MTVSTRAAAGREIRLDLEATEPISELLVTPPTEVVRLRVLVEGEPLAELELPVCDGRVDAGVLADAAADELAWTLLGRFFERTLYPKLEVLREDGGWAVWRREVRLGAVDEPEPSARAWHDRLGWALFLQEIWGRPEWPEAWFYEPPDDAADSAPVLVAEGSWLEVEVSEALPALDGEGPDLDLELAVGGVSIGRLAVPPRLGPAPLRARLTTAAGFELCRTAVREGLLGSRLDGPPLRARLAAAAQVARAARVPSLIAPSGFSLAPGWKRSAGRAFAGDAGMIVGRRGIGALGTAASRRWSLPSEAAADARIAARSGGEPVIDRPPVVGSGRLPVVYVPDLLWRPPVRAGEGAPPEPAAETVTDRLPILLYHRVAPEGAPEMARYRVTPEAFEGQLRHLRDEGYRAVGLLEWAEAIARRRPLPGRCVALTFDDGYRDFLEHAHPLLLRYGLGATMFVVAGRIGGVNRWDSELGEELPLLGWADLRKLKAEGIEIGSHAWTHRALAGLPNGEVAREALRSRSVLERELGVPVAAFSYPYGLSDGAVRHLVAASGYLVGVDSKGGRSPLTSSPLNLPRIEVEGTDDLETFVRKLEG